MTDITAEQAGKALGVVAQKLAAVGILTGEGSRALIEESNRIKRERKKKAWDVTVVRQRPIMFAPAKDKNGEVLRISLISRISVDQADDKCPPFQTLDIAVELRDEKGTPVGRWHVDKANKGQSGPRFHLQFGGHVPEHRDQDFRVKEPRWCHPPMEVALLCEVIAANFFEQTWAAKLRDDASWCDSIQLFQKLCYVAYTNMISDALNVSSSTALGKMWGDRWFS